jgi:hypothetical protein
MSVKYVLSILLNSVFSSATPIPHIIAQRSVVPLQSVDASQDAWSSTLSGVGPLVLLIGEKSTKQVLRGVRGLPTALSLSTAPLGLFSLVSSFLRLCGAQHVRAYMGYELEPRINAALELTRVNCNGVYGKLVNGYIERSADDEAATRIVQVSYLIEENLEVGAKESLSQLRACLDFELEREKLCIPVSEAGITWCLRVAYSSVNSALAIRMVNCVVSALQIADTDDVVTSIMDKLSFQSEPKTEATGKTTCTYTFPAVSEMSTRTPMRDSLAGLVGLFGFLSILTVLLCELHRLDWNLSVGLILAFLGYIGIVLFVTAAALRIHGSCASIKLHTSSTTAGSPWKNAVVITSKVNDNMNTSGTKTWRAAPDITHNFEAVWLTDPSLASRQISSVVAFALVASFICHYLGLRSCSWWVAVGELGICLLAAFGRSMTKGHQDKLRPTEGATIDWRCSSTGVIDVTTAEKIDICNRRSDSLDLRVYSEDLILRKPNSAESIAWYVAISCTEDTRLARHISKLMGSKIVIRSDGQQQSKRAVIALFNNGVITSDGLAFPNARVGVAFWSSLTNLAAPTLLLARGIFRHAEWLVSNTELHQLPLGVVHKPALSSMLTWWTLSEGRNDLADSQSNLQYALFYLNVALFVGVLRAAKHDRDLGDALKRAHENASRNDRETAERVVTFLREQFADAGDERPGSTTEWSGSTVVGEQTEKIE